VNKEGALEENYSYLYVVKKEEEANLSPIERIFGPVSEDVLAVARVKFISRDDDDDDDDDIDVKTARLIQWRTLQRHAIVSSSQTKLCL